MSRIPKRKPKTKLRVTVSSEVKDYGNDPFVIKKANETQKFLEKHPFPEELLHKK